MTVETATKISQLDGTAPPGTDPKSEGDNHLRLIKTCLKAVFDDSGTTIKTTLPVESPDGAKVNGSITLTGAINCSGNINSGQNFQSTSTTVVLAPTGAGTCYLRPNGAGSTTGQASVAADGSITATGPISSSGGIASSQNFVSSTANVVLAATGAGNVFLRPNGIGSTVGQLSVSTAGALTAGSSILALTGFMSHAGSSGGTANNMWNFNWTGGALQAWVDTVNLGNVAFTSDYRTKKDVTELAGLWDTVKALRPIRYSTCDFTPPSALADAREDGPYIVGNDIEQWGFIAHELQQTLTPSAATAEKDAADAIQSPNPWTVLAALTAALQEVMARLEVVEGAG